MNPEEKSLSEQLMVGLTGDDAPDAPETEEETPEGEEAPEGEDAGEQEESPEGEEEADEEGEEEPEGEEEADEEGQEEPPAPKKPAKEPDPINDPLPKGTLESTRERFQHVVGQLKQQTERADTAESQLNELVSSITDAGMDGEKYAVMLSYAKGVNSGDPEQMRASYNILMGELKNLATALGEPLPGTNPVEAHADLVKLLNEGKITPEIAAETALDRNRRAAAQKLQAARQNSQQGDAAFQAALQRSIADFKALGPQLAARDGQAEYKRKAQIVIDMSYDLIMQLPPAKRVAAFKKAYDKVPAAPKAAVAPAGGKPAAKKGVTPMRGNKRPSGNSTQKQPKTLLEAMKQGLSGAD